MHARTCSTLFAGTGHRLVQAAGDGVIPFQDRCAQGTTVSAEVGGAVSSVQGPRGPHGREGGAEPGGWNVVERFLTFFFNL